MTQITLKMKNTLKIILSVIVAGWSSIMAINARAIEPDTLMSVAYGTQPQWQVTSALSSVKGDDLTKSFTSNVATTLYGKLPGLVVQQGNGEPGNDSPTLRIRGIGTFGQGRDILVVIDGFPSSINCFQQLVPQEIESLTVLKDASATAIYGNRGANGVLLVTTKKGSVAPLKVNVGVQYGIQQAPRLPQFLGAYDYARLYNEALVNDKGPGSEIYSPEDIGAYRLGNDPLYHPDVNWYDQVLRSVSPLANYNFSAEGGSSIIRYFVLFNVVNNQGLYKKTENVSENTKNASYTRYNFRTNVDIDLSSRINMVVTLGGSLEDKTNPGVNENTNELFNLMASVPSNSFPVYVAPEMLGGNAIYANPWGNITQTGYTSYNGRGAQTAARLNIDLGMITPGLSISGSVGFNNYFKNFSSKNRTYSYYSVSKGDGGKPVYTTYSENTSLSGNESKTYQWRNTVFQGFLNYDRTFGKHSINAMLMANYEDYTQKNNYGDASNTHVLPYKSSGIGGRFSYGFGQRYLAEFSFGYNGNDNFAPGKRFGFFPAGSLGWVISNESFLKDNTIINYMKIRGSYGLTGNSDLGNTRFMYNQYYTGQGYFLGNPQGGRDGLIQGALANPDVTWEKERKMNIGFDATLFHDFSMSIDYFMHKRKDILAKPYSTIPDFLGANVPEMNVGKVKNAGFEASLSYEKKYTKDFMYFVEATAWFARNEIEYNAEAPQLYDYLYQTGHRIDQPFLLEAIGFFASQSDIDQSPRQIFTDVQPGDIKYKDQNNDNIIDQNDLYPIGYSALPELTLGLHLGGSYKGFDIDMLFQGAVNRSVYWSGKYFHAFQNDGNISSIALGRWTEETAATATYPRLSASNNLNNYQESSFWQKNGNFLKMRNLEIGYTIPQELTRKIKIEKIRCYLNGTNLFSLDHMDGMMDPESVTAGIGYPVMRTYSVGLSVQF